MLQRIVTFVAVLFAALSCPAATFDPSPRAIEAPAWFAMSFLDFREDIAEAAKSGKRLMVYFGQDGCPYCRELMRVNFSQQDIVEKARRNFNSVALNIWGDREVTWLDGRTYSEKAFAAMLKIQFTPTLVFFDEKGNVALRLNGYYPPHKLSAALDYVAGRNEKRIAFADFLAKNAREPSSGRLHDQPFFSKPPHDLKRAKGAKALAVLFEQKDCAACDELHAKTLSDDELRALARRFDVVRLELFGTAPLVTPAGRRTTEAAWARELNVAYTPGIVFFDASGKEVFRLEGYLRRFHVVSAFDYVASGAHAKEPSFQRYLQARAEDIRKRKGTVELW